MTKVALKAFIFDFFLFLARPLLLFPLCYLRRIFLVCFPHAQALVHFSVEAVDGVRRRDGDDITSSNHRSAGIERVKSYSPSARIGQMRPPKLDV